MRSVDVLIPAYNEAASLPALVRRILAVLEPLPYRVRVLIVDDGSSDDTPVVVAALAARDPRIGAIHLSRNFGHQAALTAGLDVADADAVVMIDADLQKPPELIPAFLEEWERGAEVVHGVRRPSRVEGMFKRVSSRAFYRLLNRLSDVPLVNDSPDFRLLDARVVRAARNLREQDRFLRGLVAWAGFRQVSIPYDEAPRAHGRSKYDPMRMFALALAGVLGFSRLPLRLATFAGLAVSLFSFVYGTYVFVMHFFYREPVQGWASLALLISLLCGAQMMFLGLLGEYIGQVLMETKARPLYLVRDRLLPPLVRADADEDGAMPTPMPQPAAATGN